VISQPGPVAFLRARITQGLAAAKRFHVAAGVALDETMESALHDLPLLGDASTPTDRGIAEVARLGGKFMDAVVDAMTDMETAHVEADLLALEAASLARKEE
jgi:hypothetical protein